MSHCATQACSRRIIVERSNMPATLANKRSLDDLALFGGRPAFAEKVHVGRPNVPDRKKFMKRVEDIFDRRWFSNNGACGQELERKLEAYLGVKHCIAVCNATVGLELAIRAFGLKGEV